MDTVQLFALAKDKHKMRVTCCGGRSLEYVLLNSGDDYGCDVVNEVVGSYEEGVSVMSDCERIFVFERNVPFRVRKFVVYHEYHEGRWIRETGRWGIGHAVACRKEMDEVLRANPDVIAEYARWLVMEDRKRGTDTGYFCRALPDFGAVLRDFGLDYVEILVRFKERLDRCEYLK